MDSAYRYACSVIYLFNKSTLNCAIRRVHIWTPSTEENLLIFYRLLSISYSNLFQLLGYRALILSHVGGGGVCVTNNRGSRSDDWINLPTLQLHLVTINTTRTYKQYSAIADFHTFHFTAAQALRFSLSTSRCLVADLNAGTVTSNHYEVFLPFLLHSPWNADPILQF
jgi:hypothetical protein